MLKCSKILSKSHSIGVKVEWPTRKKKEEIKTVWSFRKCFEVTLSYNVPQKVY